jgi:hypothetical protein
MRYLSNNELDKLYAIQENKGNQGSIEYRTSLSLLPVFEEIKFPEDIEIGFGTRIVLANKSNLVARLLSDRTINSWTDIDQSFLDALSLKLRTELQERMGIFIGRQGYLCFDTPVKVYIWRLPISRFLDVYSTYDFYPKKASNKKYREITDEWQPSIVHL